MHVHPAGGHHKGQVVVGRGGGCGPLGRALHGDGGGGEGARQPHEGPAARAVAAGGEEAGPAMRRGLRQARLADSGTRTSGHAGRLAVNLELEGRGAETRASAGGRR